MPTQKTPSTQKLGTWLSIGCPVIAEIAADCGFDWALIDLEHGCGTEADVPDQLRALRGSATLAVVRIGAVRPESIARLLDWGAGGLMAPHVNTVCDAEACVRAMRYPPRGARGVSRSVRAYRYGLDPMPVEGTADPLFLAQIETYEAVQNAAAIAAVDGVDVLFVGPADLQADLQVRGLPGEQEYGACLERVADAAGAAGKQCGILLRNPVDLPRIAALGYRWIAVDSDISLLRAGYQRILSGAG